MPLNLASVLLPCVFSLVFSPSLSFAFPLALKMRNHLAKAVLLCYSAGRIALASQVPFTPSYAPADNVFGDYKRIELPLAQEATSQFTSVQDIIAAEKGKHVVVSHTEFPSVSIRIKQMSHKSKTVDEMMAFKGGSDPKFNLSDPHAFCDPTVNSWSGCE